MSQKANPKLIGLFVLGTIALLVLFIVALGGAKIFAEKHYYVLYFRDSLNGLNIGAPVKFRGVEVGSVENIIVQLDREHARVNMPVIIGMIPDRVMVVGGEKVKQEDFTDAMVKQGLRAQLKMSSMITGQLYVELDFHPKHPIEMPENNTQYMQIPTIGSGAKALDNALDSGRRAFEGINKLINSEEFIGGIKAFRAAMEETRRLASDIDRHVNPLTQSIRDAFDKVSEVVGSEDVDVAVESFREAMHRAKTLLTGMDNQLEPMTEVFDEAAQNFSDAMYSVKVLSDYLSRHPEALIKGKLSPKGGN